MGFFLFFFFANVGIDYLIGGTTSSKPACPGIVSLPCLLRGVYGNCGYFDTTSSLARNLLGATAWKNSPKKVV